MPAPLKIPLTPEGTMLQPGREPPLAPGVMGYAILCDDESLYIPVINAVKEGSGHVGKFLDSLPTDRDIKVPSVVSVRLEAMLFRRGFVMSTEYDDDGNMMNIWLRKAAVEESNG